MWCTRLHDHFSKHRKIVRSERFNEIKNIFLHYNLKDSSAGRRMGRRRKEMTRSRWCDRPGEYQSWSKSDPVLPHQADCGLSWHQTLHAQLRDGSYLLPRLHQVWFVSGSMWKVFVAPSSLTSIAGSHFLGFVQWGCQGILFPTLLSAFQLLIWILSLGHSMPLEFQSTETESIAKNFWSLWGAWGPWERGKRGPRLFGEGF